MRRAKRARKGCDWILANDVSPATGTFGGDSNTIHLVDDGRGRGLAAAVKRAVAERLAQRIAASLEREGGGMSAIAVAVCKCCRMATGCRCPPMPTPGSAGRRSRRRARLRRWCFAAGARGAGADRHRAGLARGLRGPGAAALGPGAQARASPCSTAPARSTPITAARSASSSPISAASPSPSRRGERIAQLVVAPVSRVALASASPTLPASARGAGGFGSTGR